MAEKLFIENEIEIQAPAEKVWDALVNPEMTQKYMFGCKVVSSFEVGSPVLWQGDVDGQVMTFVKGDVVVWEPLKCFAYTAFDPNTTVPDIPENYLTVTYTLSENNGSTFLTVSQGDYALVDDGQARYEHSESNGGWYVLLLMIKELVETGKIEFNAEEGN